VPAREGLPGSDPVDRGEETSGKLPFDQSLSGIGRYHAGVDYARVQIGEQNLDAGSETTVR